MTTLAKKKSEFQGKAETIQKKKKGVIVCVCHREREFVCEREIVNNREREREIGRRTSRQKETEREKEREKQTHTQAHIHRERDRQRESAIE